MATNEILMTPEQFLSQIQACKDVETVIKIVGILNRQLRECYPNLGTLSKNLTKYRNILKSQEFESKFLENVTTKQGEISQHVGIKLIGLTADETSKLQANRQSKANSKAGFNNDGKFVNKEVKPISISELFGKIENWYLSNDVNKLALYIMIGTGLRGENVCISEKIDVDGSLISRDLRYYDSFLIAVKSISKKRGNEKNNSYVIQTILPAQNVAIAYQKLVSLSSIQEIKNQNFTNTDVRKSLERFFKSNLEGYFDNFEDYGSLHKIRGLYACLLMKLIKNEGLNTLAAKKIIQKNLIHDSQSETEKYLAKFEGELMVDVPKNIEIETNINELGEIEFMPEKTIEKIVETIVETDIETDIETTVETTVEGINMAAIISKLPIQIQAKFAEIVAENDGDIESVLAQAIEKLVDSKPKNLKACDYLENIFKACDIYNSKCLSSTDKMYPGFAAIDKIYQQITGKKLAAKSYSDIFSKLESKLMENLQDIPVIDLRTWNHKNHRKYFQYIAKNIIEIYNTL